jgi:hypothetical protein
MKRVTVQARGSATEDDASERLALAFTRDRSKARPVTSPEARKQPAQMYGADPYKIADIPLSVWITRCITSVAA